MKRTSKSIRTNELLIDAVEFVFTEWLIRRGIFAAFKSNYEFNSTPYESFRDWLRSKIRCCLHDRSLDPKCLIASSFLFNSTPEGVKFWDEQSVAWERFCDKLKTKL